MIRLRQLNNSASVHDISQAGFAGIPSGSIPSTLHSTNAIPIAISICTRRVTACNANSPKGIARRREKVGKPSKSPSNTQCRTARMVEGCLCRLKLRVRWMGKGRESHGANQRWRVLSQRVNVRAVRAGRRAWCQVSCRMARRVAWTMKREACRAAVWTGGGCRLSFLFPRGHRTSSAADWSQREAAMVRYFWFWRVLDVRLTSMQSMSKSQGQEP